MRDWMEIVLFRREYFSFFLRRRQNRAGHLAVYIVALGHLGSGIDGVLNITPYKNSIVI